MGALHWRLPGVNTPGLHLPRKVNKTAMDIWWSLCGRVTCVEQSDLYSPLCGCFDLSAADTRL